MYITLCRYVMLVNVKYGEGIRHPKSLKSDPSDTCNSAIVRGVESGDLHTTVL